MLHEVAARLPDPAAAGRRVLVGIDGVDGSGKTTFADQLADVLRMESPVVRVSLDGFHRLSRERYLLGRDSPEGFWQDSYDYDAFRRLVVNPLSPVEQGSTVKPAIIWPRIS